MSQNQLSDKDNEFLQGLVTKYKAYSKPTDNQKLLIALYNLPNKNDDDFKKLQALLKVERKAIAHYNAQKKVKDLLKAEKDKERKALEHNKFLLGGWLWGELSKKNPQLVQMVNQAIQDKKINAYDKDGKFLFGEVLSSVQINSNQGASHANP